MCEVVAYKRLRTMENHQPSGPKSGRFAVSYRRSVVVYYEVPNVRF